MRHEPNEQHTILTVTVGSHLHGTAVEGSDFDQRSVVVTPLRAILDPFVQGSAIVQQTIDGVPRPTDHVSYELKTFCSKVVQGNPTLTEVLFDPLVDRATDEGARLQRMRRAFLDSDAIKRAHKGFMVGQLTRSRREAPPRPRGKLLSSAIIGGLQAITLLTHHDVDPSKLLDGRDGYWTLSSFHRELKSGDVLAANDADAAVCILLDRLDRLTYDPITPQYEEIKEFVFTTYMTYITEELPYA